MSAKAYEKSDHPSHCSAAVFLGLGVVPEKMLAIRGREYITIFLQVR